VLIPLLLFPALYVSKMGRLPLYSKSQILDFRKLLALFSALFPAPPPPPPDFPHLREFVGRVPHIEPFFFLAFRACFPFSTSPSHDFFFLSLGHFHGTSIIFRCAAFLFLFSQIGRLLLNLPPTPFPLYVATVRHYSKLVFLTRTTPFLLLYDPVANDHPSSSSTECSLDLSLPFFLPPALSRFCLGGSLPFYFLYSQWQRLRLLMKSLPSVHFSLYIFIEALPSLPFFTGLVISSGRKPLPSTMQSPRNPTLTAFLLLTTCPFRTSQ